jgi:dihydroneopterin triphosphate diphosphatase
MAKIRADGIAVYVYKRAGQAIDFLQLRRSANTGEYQHSWQICYGGIKEGETSVQAALRELKEETGLIPREMHQVEYLEQFFFRPHDYVLVMPVFAVRVDAADPITLNDEHDAFRWISSAQIETHFMWRTQREALRIILDEILHPGLATDHLRVDLQRER